MFRYLLSDIECRWVMGNVERKTDRFERTTRIEDRAICVYEFANGARAMILSDVTDTIYQGAQIYGTEGQITLTTDDLQLLNAETGGKWRLHRPDGKFFKVDAEGERFEWLEGGAAQADELADWIEGISATHRGSAENGYKALEMIHGVYESARCHERVMMPMQTRVSPLDLMVESGHLVPERPGAYDIRAFLLRGETFWGHAADKPEQGGTPHDCGPVAFNPPGCLRDSNGVVRSLGDSRQPDRADVERPLADWCAWLGSKEAHQREHEHQRYESCDTPVPDEADVHGCDS
jgi:hypothetical protein